MGVYLHESCAASSRNTSFAFAIVPSSCALCTWCLQYMPQCTCATEWRRVQCCLTFSIKTLSALFAWLCWLLSAVVFVSLMERTRLAEDVQRRAVEHVCDLVAFLSEQLGGKEPATLLALDDYQPATPEYQRRAACWLAPPQPHSPLRPHPHPHRERSPVVSHNSCCSMHFACVSRLAVSFAVVTGMSPISLFCCSHTHDHSSSCIVPVLVLAFLLYVFVKRSLILWYTVHRRRLKRRWQSWIYKSTRTVQYSKLLRKSDMKW